MNAIILVKRIYNEGFKNLGHFLVKNFFKGYAWFSFALFSIAVYAFLVRIFTGFAFD